MPLDTLKPKGSRAGTELEQTLFKGGTICLQENWYKDEIFKTVSTCEHSQSASNGVQVFTPLLSVFLHQTLDHREGVYGPCMLQPDKF